MTTTGALRIAVPGQKHDRARGDEDRPGGDRGGKGGRRWTHRVVDLRGLGGKVRTLHYPAGDLVVVSGLPGSGKSTMMRRVTAGARSPAGGGPPGRARPGGGRPAARGRAAPPGRGGPTNTTPTPPPP
ncbi:hypothetical protein ACFW9F_25810, partial [Streptomyces sp. NPDC059506]